MDGVYNMFTNHELFFDKELPGSMLFMMQQCIEEIDPKMQYYTRSELRASFIIAAFYFTDYYSKEGELTWMSCWMPICKAVYRKPMQISDAFDSFPLIEEMYCQLQNYFIHKIRK